MIFILDNHINNLKDSILLVNYLTNVFNSKSKEIITSIFKKDTEQLKALLQSVKKIPLYNKKVILSKDIFDFLEQFGDHIS